MLRAQPFIGDRRLLVEDHPRHHHGADIRRRQIEIVLVGIRDVERLPASMRGGIGMRGEGDEEERQLEQPDRDRRPLHPAVGAGDHHGQQGERGDRQGGDARQAVQLAHAGHAGELGQQRADRGDAQAGGGHPAPERAERVADQLAVAAAGEDAQPDGQFLHHVEDRDQHELQQQQPVAPLHAALPGGDHAADVGVGQHHHQARARTPPGTARRAPSAPRRWPDVCTCSPAITADILQPAGPAGIASDSQLRRVTRAGERHVNRRALICPGDWRRKRPFAAGPPKGPPCTRSSCTTA